MKLNSLNTDNYIAFAVLLQSLLLILQQVMISVLHMPEESTTIYRVLLTAIPLSGAIIVAFYRKCSLFLSVYFLTGIILIYNILIFPQNESYLLDDSLRFLLPVVIPSALCIMCISSIKVIENILYKISWIIVILMIVYVGSLLSGKFSFTGYNMGLSYGLLLPTMSLYSKKHWMSICMALFLFIVILALGSRGAAVVLVLYLCYDILQSNGKLLLPMIVLSSVFLACLPLFLEWLEGYGIHSRTLILLLSDQITSSSGRDYLYDQMLQVFWNNPLMGIGLYGDRANLGTYCHNIILELYLNWGIFVASLILFIFIYKLVQVYTISTKENRNILVKYFLGMVFPLMVSGSYLTDYNFGTFIGILYLLNKEDHKPSFKLLNCNFNK